MAKMLSRLISLLPACTARGTWYWVSSTISLILRPWMPPCGVDLVEPHLHGVRRRHAVGGGRARTGPCACRARSRPCSRPRVAFCATATPGQGHRPEPATTHSPASLLHRLAPFVAVLTRSLGSAVATSPRTWRRSASLYFTFTNGALELHGRRQLLVLGGEDLLDEAELLDASRPGRTAC